MKSREGPLERRVAAGEHELNQHGLRASYGSSVLQRRRTNDPDDTDPLTERSHESGDDSSKKGDKGDKGDRGPLAPPDIVVVAAAVATTLGVRAADVRASVVAGSICALGAITFAVIRSRRRRPALTADVGTVPAASSRTDDMSRFVPMLFVLCLVFGVGGALRSASAWQGVAPDTVGAYAGWVRVVDDPQPYGGATRVIVEVEGERFETWVRGRARQLRARVWRGGEYVLVSGERRMLDAERARRVAWQHVVGEFAPEWMGDVRSGSALDTASNRVRAAIERAGDQLEGDEGALYRGLVVGDDRDQPSEMIERFRASGLAHLTAVSGQNVAFVLAVAAPLLGRMRTAPRVVVTFGLIAWFVALTRFEPSIVRAGVMAMLSTFAVARGHERGPIRVLSLAVILLLLADPLIAWSIGFWLSVGATAGVSVIGPWLADRMCEWWAASRWRCRHDEPTAGSGSPAHSRDDRAGRSVAVPLATTIGAQVGVAIPAVLVFGRLPFVSVLANVLAAPVAGAVMLYGLPAGLLAGAVPQVGPVVMFPIRIGVRWVDLVAALGARVEPPGHWPWVGWFLLGCALAVVVVRSKRNESVEQAEW